MTRSRSIALGLVVLLALACGPSGSGTRAAPPESEAQRAAPAPPAAGSPAAAAPQSAAPAGTTAGTRPTIQVPPTRVRASHSVVSGNIAPYWLAVDAGLWKQHGLDVELILISGAPTSMAALLSGETLFAAVSGEAGLAMQVQNPDVVSIANASAASTHRLIVTPEHERVEDLRGKRIGVFTHGDGNYVLMSKILLKYGVNPDRDVIWTPVGGGNMAGLVTALAVGAIDAALLTPPNDLPAIKNGGRVLLALADLELPSAGLPVFTMRRTLVEQRPVVEAFLAGLVDGIHLYKTDPEQGKGVLRRYANLTDPEALDWTYDVFRGKTMADKPFIDVAQTRAVVDALVHEQPELRQLQWDRIIDNSVLEDLDRKGYFAGR